MSLIAAGLSLIVPGAGQVLNREHEQGLIIFGLWLLWLFVSNYLFKAELYMIAMGWLIFLGYSVFNALLFDPKNIKQEDVQLQEFQEMEEEKKQAEEKELKEARELLEKNLEKEHESFDVLEMKKKGKEITAKAIIDGQFYELTVSPSGEIEGYR